jgi:hypothetical protein
MSSNIEEDMTKEKKLSKSSPEKSSKKHLNASDVVDSRIVVGTKDSYIRVLKHFIIWYKKKYEDVSLQNESEFDMFADENFMTEENISNYLSYYQYFGKEVDSDLIDDGIIDPNIDLTDFFFVVLVNFHSILYAGNRFDLK